jgi:hypothetical protein
MEDPTNQEMENITSDSFKLFNFFWFLEITIKILLM